jgi:hypothetical protein
MIFGSPQKALSALFRIDSPLKSLNGLIPKVSYDDGGVYYDPEDGIFVKIEIEEGVIAERTPVVPVSVVFSNLDGNYPIPDDHLLDAVECDFCGEADDLSCYLYFKFC